jgi:hypothetical protein
MGKPEFLGIKKVYTSNFLHTTLWAFITGQRQTGKDINSAVRSFIEYFDADELDPASLRHAYYIKDKELKKCMSGISCDVKTVFKDDDIDKILVKMKNVLTDGR